MTATRLLLILCAGLRAVNTTKEGVKVKVGQVWRDLDPRSGERYCRVIELGYTGNCQTIEAALMKPCGRNGNLNGDRITKVRISRMHRHGTGWEMVRP